MATFTELELGSGTVSLQANQQETEGEMETEKWPRLRLVGAVRASYGRVIWPLVGLAVFIGAWQGAIAVFHIPSYLASTPYTVARELVNQRGLFLSNLYPTALESIVGFALGNIGAIMLAVVFVYSRHIRAAFFPTATIIRTVPIVAVAPLFVLYLGFGYGSKIAVAALITFFPTMINMVVGLEAVDPQLLELMRLLSARESSVLLRLRVPSSLPYFFAAMKIAAPGAVIGAIIAEWIGSQRGLGFLIIDSTQNYLSAELYATMVVASAFALFLLLLVSLSEKVLHKWTSAD